MKYTIKNFHADFPDDKTCLAFIFRHRYPKGLTCPKCDKSSFHAVEGRRSYACACGYQVYPTEGTIFHKSPTPLTLWFHAIFLMSQSKNGAAAKELQRHLGVTYKCAWRIAKQIRLLMSPDGGPLGGLEIIEADETYVGGVHTNTIEGFWSQFKRSVHGTFHAVSPKHLQTYLNEFSFRYNHRGQNLPRVMFSRVATLLPKVS